MYRCRMDGAQTRSCGVSALLRDYDFAADAATAAVGRALQLSAHVLRLDAALFRGQLVGRLMGSATTAIAALLDSLTRSGDVQLVVSRCRHADGRRVCAGGHLTGHTADVTGVAVSADFRRAVSCSHDHGAVWDLERLAELRVLRGHSVWVTAVAVSAAVGWR